ncbi:hypothetical protein Pfo_007081 [Paulownia fortunei]|nr:hypothetical protein Pfo_007081 [Paulownia fortunei]
MYTDLNPISLMGLPSKTTSATFLSEKGFHAILKRDFFEELHKEGPTTEGKSVVSVSLLKTKLPPPGAVHEEQADGCRTPTALDHNRKKKNTAAVKCPPAPRKPKALPSTKRRKEGVLLLDLSSEIESFSLHFCSKIFSVER